MELLEGIQILHPAPGSRQVHCCTSKWQLQQAVANSCSSCEATGSGSLALMPVNLCSRQGNQLCGTRQLQDRAQARQQSPQEIELMDRLTELAAARAPAISRPPCCCRPAPPGSHPSWSLRRCCSCCRVS